MCSLRKGRPVTFYADQGGFEISHLNFVSTGTPASEVGLGFVNAKTEDANHIRLTLNKPFSFLSSRGRERSHYRMTGKC